MHKVSLLAVFALLFSFAFETDEAFAQAARPNIVIAAETVEWLPIDQALTKAQETGKKILVDVYAPWCGFCRRMHAETFSDPSVSKYIAENYVATRVDGDSDRQYNFMGRSFTGTQLAGQLGAQGFPTTVFLFSTGQYLTPLSGFVPSEMFVPVLQYISTDAFESQSFEEFTTPK
jgi:thioredoxin-related protein